MKILLIILLILVFVVAIVLILAMFQPKSVRFSRKIFIGAAKAEVYGHVGSLQAYHTWNPWAQDDPTQEVTFGGEDGAVGSTMAWEGKRTGMGIMTISEAKGPDTVTYDLEFIKPFKGQARARLTLSDMQGGTEVEWHYEGENAFIARVFAVFMNFEKMIGGQYDKGLAELKELAEKSS